MSARSEDTAKDLWVPMVYGQEATPRMRASQILEMLVHYRLITYAWVDGEKFTVQEESTRVLDAAQVIEEFGDRVADMVSRVQTGSDKITDVVPVPMDHPVPYIHDCTDRVVEYSRFWR